MNLVHQKIGIIGAGKLAQALLRSLLKSGYPENLFLVSHKTKEGQERFHQKFPRVQCSLHNPEILAFADILFLGIKPFQFTDLAEEIKEHINKNQLVVSLMAGTSTGKLCSALGIQTHLIRVMANTPACIGHGMLVVADSPSSSTEEQKFLADLLSRCGKTEIIPESLFPAVTAAAGSSPAFVFTLMQNFIDASVGLGLSPKQAETLVVQSFKGASLFAETRMGQLAQLIKEVATPGGCTEVGLNVLKSQNSQKLIDQVLNNTAEKSKTL